MARWTNSLLARLLIAAGFPLVLYTGAFLVCLFAVLRLRDGLGEERSGRDLLLTADECGDTAGRLDRVIAADGFDPKKADLREDLKRLTDSGARLQELLDSLPRYAYQAKHWRDVVGRFGIGFAVFGDEEPMPPDPDKWLKEARLVLAELRADLERLRRAEEWAALARRDALNEKTDESLLVIAVVVPAAVAVGLAVNLWVTRSVTGPVRRLKEGAKKLPSGEFEVIPAHGPNELAELTVHFNHAGLTLSEQAKSMLRQQRRYQKYIGASALILWLADADGRVTEDLPAWRAYTGQTPEELTGDGWLAAVHPDDRGPAESDYRAAVGAGEPFEAELRLRAADGTHRPFLMRAVAVQVNSDASSREWIGALSDISEVKRQEQLRLAVEEARAASRAKSEFMTRVSHELRTPLNGVIGFARMLSAGTQGPLNEAQANYVEEIIQAGMHLLSLVDRLLGLSEAESGRLELRLSDVDLGGMVRACVESLRPLAAAKERPLDVTVRGDAGTLHVDEGRLWQVLFNLLSNAIKFTDSGSVTASWEWLDGSVRVVVADTGPGIPPAEQELIWREFRQGAAGADPSVGGAGLGLPLTKQLVELMGGRVELTSKPGEGSAFTVVLPS